MKQALRKALAERVVAAGPVGVSARVAAFIGPTGVGKTTTIAKIAARASLMDGARVALITIDTFRVGAIDQLQRYADLMELPLHVAGTSAALRAAVRNNQGADLILVDTAGRGPRRDCQLGKSEPRPPLISSSWLVGPRADRAFFVNRAAFWRGMALAC